MPADNEYQKGQMRWILFYVFLGLFVVIVAWTVLAVFMNVGNISAAHRDTLFNAFIVEIGAAVIALFYSIFELKPARSGDSPRLRLNISETDDPRQLVGKTATLDLSRADGGIVGEPLTYRILDDNGPYIPLQLPQRTHDVYVTVKIGNDNYSGSFVVG